MCQCGYTGGESYTTKNLSTVTRKNIKIFHVKNSGQIMQEHMSNRSYNDTIQLQTVIEPHIQQEFIDFPPGA